MVSIPLGVGAYTRTTSEQPATVHRNFLVEKDVSGGAEAQTMHVQRPGLVGGQALAGSGIVRALGYSQGLFSNRVIAVAGTSLVSYGSGGVTVMATVADDGKPAQLAFTNFGVAVLSSGTLYFYDTSLHTVTVPASKVPVSITSIDSYVIVFCSDGTWFWLVPGDLVIDPLHFATAESMPDGGVAVYALHDECFFFGSSSIEPWGTTGQPDLIMEPSPGRRVDHGLLFRDTLQPLDNTVYFVADNGQVMRLGGGEPERVSNAGIEERIGLRSGACSALTFTYQGHSLYVLYIPGQGSFAYDVTTGTWSEFRSAQLSTGWIAGCAVMLGDTVYLGDRSTANLYGFDSGVSTDNNVVFERAVSGIVNFSGGWHRNDIIQVWAGASSDATLRLRYHDGNTTTYSSYLTRTIRAPQDIVIWRQLGAAYPPFRIIEISTVDYAIVRISAADANTGRAA